TKRKVDLVESKKPDPVETKAGSDLIGSDRTEEEPRGGRRRRRGAPETKC
ncbi:hypothetical protein TorRG33x02_006160, partial [Trema orientale]